MVSNKSRLSYHLLALSVSWEPTMRTRLLQGASGKVSMLLFAFLSMAFISQASQSTPAGQAKGARAGDLEQRAYFAFVDHDYIFTVEVVGPGVLLLNFVSMTEDAKPLSAKQVRVKLENRTVAATSFLIDTGDPAQPLITASLTMRPRSSFGARIRGDYGEAKELLGVTIRVGEEDLTLAPLTSLAFENLVLKVNRINLASPDFRDDWQALKLEIMGTRARKRVSGLQNPVLGVGSAVQQAAEGRTGF